MIGRTIPNAAVASVQSVRRQRKVVWVLGSGVVAVVGMIVTTFASSASQQSGIALFVLLGTIVAAAIRPICGLYAIVVFTLFGDGETSAWSPFAKNLSSRESLLYLSDKLSLSPLEIVIAMTVMFWLIELFGNPGLRLVKGPVFAATSVFTGFVVFGFIVGVGRGGDSRIALFEGRAIFLLLPVYALIVNVCDGPALRRLAWTAFGAIFIHALFALNYLDGLSPLERETKESLGEHSASIHWNSIILLTLVLFLYRASRRSARFLLLAGCIPVGIVYLFAQRRSAIAGLAVGLALIVLSLFWRHRVKFFVLGPLLFIGTVGYTLAFWNSTSTAGFPAQAIKTLVAPDDVSAEDASSDLYRQIENFDINYTIRSSPLLGLGFGQKFLRPIPLPDISFFEFHEYIPHNSLLWIWIKTGFGGFASMLMMFAVAIRAGARSAIGAIDATSAAFGLIGAVYVAMFATFAFVDIAWDPRSMVFLAVSFALCSQHERLRAAPVTEQSLPATMQSQTV